jgi:hypothetical protein
MAARPGPGLPSRSPGTGNLLAEIDALELLQRFWNENECKRERVPRPISAPQGFGHRTIAG